MYTWFTLQEKPIKRDQIIVVKQKGMPIKRYSTYYMSKYISGMIELTKEKDKYIWNGHTFILQVEKYRVISFLDSEFPDQED